MTDLTRFDVLDRRAVEVKPAPRPGRLFAWIVDFIVITIVAVFVTDVIRPGSRAIFFDSVSSWGSAIGADSAALF